MCDSESRTRRVTFQTTFAVPQTLILRRFRMANDLNVVCLVGNLTADLGSRERDYCYTQAGMCIATVSVAVNRRRKGDGGEYVDEVSFFDVHIYGRTAEALKPYLRKGQKIAVEGALRQERWKDSQGANHSRVVINASNVQLLGGRPGDSVVKENLNTAAGPAAFSPQTVYPTAQQAQAAAGQQYQGLGSQEQQFSEDLPWDDQSIPF